MNETKYDFEDGNDLVPAHQHENGGGWIANSAKVWPTAYVGPQARVSGKAWVSDKAAGMCENTIWMAASRGSRTRDGSQWEYAEAS